MFHCFSCFYGVIGQLQFFNTEFILTWGYSCFVPWMCCLCFIQSTSMPCIFISSTYIYAQSRIRVLLVEICQSYFVMYSSSLILKAYRLLSSDGLKFKLREFLTALVLQAPFYVMNPIKTCPLSPTLPGLSRYLLLGFK
mmetsp:Transcript_33319/g.6022  ORF Transcript_33319/g.6022 Transcript_33319/m.6022 type:complete len:139 (+) Transcript_33319:1154-1570(+)